MLKLSNFSEDAFFTTNEKGERVLRELIIVDGADGVQKEWTKDAILLMENFKLNKVRGVADPLKGKTVFLISLPKTNLMIPTDALDFGSTLHSFLKSATAQYIKIKENEVEGD